MAKYNLTPREEDLICAAQEQTLGRICTKYTIVRTAEILCAESLDKILKAYVSLAVDVCL